MCDVCKLKEGNSIFDENGIEVVVLCDSCAESLFGKKAKSVPLSDKTARRLKRFIGRISSI